MKTTMLGSLAALALFSGIAQASPVYYYPMATADDTVVLAGPDTATICTNRVAPPPNTYVFWSCTPVALYGALEPIEATIWADGPVKVLNARWAWIRRGNDLIPMLAD